MAKKIDQEKRAYVQKYSLQRRDPKGSFRKIATFTEPITCEQVQRDYGPGSYILRRTKPKFATEWKAELGQQTNMTTHVEKRTKLLTAGFAVVAIGEVLGFGLTHLRFNNLEEKVDQLTAAFQNAIKPTGLSCALCSASINVLLQKRCTNCGATIGWPRSYSPNQSSIDRCTNTSCKLQVSPAWSYCMNCGQRLPIQSLRVGEFAT